ncbi:MAG TPA: S8 family serine peptidase [Microlunatus sp.]
MIGSAQPPAQSPDLGWVGAAAAPTTGRHIVVFADTDIDAASMMRTEAGMTSIATSRDFEGAAIDVSQTEAADATVFSELGIAVMSADPSQFSALQKVAASGERIVSISPELINHVMPGQSADYAGGYADGVADLVARLGSGQSIPDASEPPLTPGREQPPFADTAQATWGLQATGVISSPYSGRGVRVAVLDTGFDATHPDFLGRQVTLQSFVAGEAPQDGHGHGTHCVGTSCGPRMPETGRRYGVAYEADIFVGKVLSDGGSGGDAGVLAGINWAVANGCQVISMSLGSDFPQVHPPYVAAGRRALNRGSLIVAAAGNNADRRVGNFGFVGPPANSPAVVAVGALEQQLAVAYFSARSLAATRGGQVDLAAPGWQVYSSWPMPTRYRSISGTSMATPHVAGLAALWAQQTGLRGRELWATLTQEDTRLLAPSADVGGGLPLAPQ